MDKVTNLKTPYYLFDANEFKDNYFEFLHTFQSIYPNYQPAYSFKTNYTPAVCELIKSYGGYAEVVSDMEYDLALKIGFPAKHIIYNGPVKQHRLEYCMLHHSILNIDNLWEVNRVAAIAQKHPNEKFCVGLRVNFGIGTDLLSRFGIDVTNGDLNRAIEALSGCANVKINGLHFHISRARGLEAWKNRIETILKIADQYFTYQLDYLDIGSGMYGKLDPELQKQFGKTPTYADYANTVAWTMADHYKDTESKPLLITEPGTTVVSKYFHLFTTVLDIKNIRNKYFALIDCSYQNVGEICGLKRIPIRLHGNVETMEDYKSVDLVGYTCLEQDVILHDYQGKLAQGAVVEICNVGGYSIVDKPPFIHPDIPIYMASGDRVTCIKREQTFDDIFAPYVFSKEGQSC